VPELTVQVASAGVPATDEVGGLDPTLAFTHHGVALGGNGAQLTGECPFCGKEKLSVEAATGLWRCFVCGRDGNPLEFLRQLWAACDAATNGWARKLADERGLMDAATVTAWGACKSVVDGGWLVPGYNVRGELTQLYCRRQVRGSDGAWSQVLLPTPGVWEPGRVHALHMPSMDFDPARQSWWFAEGPWDGMALWEVGRQARRVENSDAIEVTGNPAASVLAGANVLAVPGCTTWRDDWTEACRGKDVYLPYDNDHPLESGAKAGADGVRRIAGKLAGVAASVSWVSWGGGGYDASLPDGFDVRDALVRGLP
jgi:hypothetical protein